jgi:PAS domain S-box-containing protein
VSDVRHAIEWPGGRRVLLSINAAPLLDEAGQVDGIVATVEDVTAQVRAEEALQFTQFAVDRTSDAAFWMGPDARFIYVNQAACRDLGYSREELLRMTVHDIDPNFPPEVWPDHWREIKERGSFTLQSHNRTREGRVFPVEITVNYLKFKGQEYNCAFARDVSERLRAEEERERLIQELQDALAQVKTLSGLLPICANCKKIRDDGGYWQDVAVYIRDHSEAEFSHGLCPECFNEFYSDFLDESE